MQTTENQRFAGRDVPLDTVWLKRRWQTISLYHKLRAVSFVFVYRNKRIIYFATLPGFLVLALPGLDASKHLAVSVITLLIWFYAGLYARLTRKL